MAEGELVPQRESVVQIKVGGRSYPAVRKPRCTVCMHPARFFIEERLLLNYSYPAVLRQVSDLDHRRPDGDVENWPELTVDKLRTHYKNGHCPLDTNMSRDLAQQRAEKMGLDIETGYGQFIDHVVVQKEILKRGHELLVSGAIEPDVKDTLAASKLLGDLEKEVNNNTSQEQWQEFMGIYFASVRQVVSNEQWAEITERISSHPAFQRLTQQRNVVEEEDE